MMHYRGVVLPPDLQLSPDMAAELVTRICRPKKVVEPDRVRFWLAHGRLDGQKQLKTGNGRERDGKWAVTWQALVQALEGRTIPPARHLKAAPEPAGTQGEGAISVALPGPVLAAAETLAAAAGVSVEEVVRRALVIAAEQAGLLSPLGVPRAGAA